MFSSSTTYLTGDFVKISISENNKTVHYGKIQEIEHDKGTFTYTQYMIPQETHVGILNHHSTNEIFKTDVILNSTINKILGQAILFSMPQYYQQDVSQIQEVFFIQRQSYYPVQKKFDPETIDECICKKQINPDEQIIMCEGCEKFYHHSCIAARTQQPNPTCDLCDRILNMELRNANLLKRKSVNDFEDQLIPLKVTNNGYNFQQFQKRLKKPSPTSENQNMLSSVNANHHQGSSGNKKDTLHQHHTTTIINNQKNQNRKVYTNLSDAHYKEMMQIVDKYLKANPFKYCTGIEKDRFNGREKLFTYFIYGLEEIQQNYETSMNREMFNEEEQGIINLDERQKHDLARKLAIETEASVFSYYNKNQTFKINQEYRERFRILLVNLRDEKNQELRKKILLKKMTPYQLSMVKEEELICSQKLQEKIERDERNLQASLIDNKIQIMAKSHKGQTILERISDQEASFYMATSKESENVTEIQDVKQNVLSMEPTDDTEHVINEYKSIQQQELSKQTMPATFQTSNTSNPKVTQKQNSKQQQKQQKQQQQKIFADKTNQIVNKNVNNNLQNDKNCDFQKNAIKKYLDPELSQKLNSLLSDSYLNRFQERIQQHLPEDIIAQLQQQQNY